MGPEEISHITNSQDRQRGQHSLDTGDGRRSLGPKFLHEPGCRLYDFERGLLSHRTCLLGLPRYVGRQASETGTTDALPVRMVATSAETNSRLSWCARLMRAKIPSALCFIEQL